MGLCQATLCNNHSTNTVSQAFEISTVMHSSFCIPSCLGLLICFTRYSKLDGGPGIGSFFKKNGNKSENVQKMDEIYRKFYRK